MHCLSTALGFSMSWISPFVTKIVVTALFLIMGTYGMVTSLKAMYCTKKKRVEGTTEESEDEFEEALEEVEKYEAEVLGKKSNKTIERTDDGKEKKAGCCEWMYKCKSPYLFFMALLTCSEWGDKS